MGTARSRRGSSQWPLEANFTLYATTAPTHEGDGTTFYSTQADARVHGTFAGLPILSGSKQEGWVGKSGPL